RATRSAVGRVTMRRAKDVVWLGAVWAGTLFVSCLATTAQPQPAKLKILDPTPKVIVVNGYSTSMGQPSWPGMLQQKLDRYFDGKRVIEVKSATKGGTPIAKWIDVATGEPREPWLSIVRPRLAEAGDRPTIVLCQQSLQWAFGNRRAGIRSEDDAEHIRQGADAMEKYVKLLKQDGADLVFLGMHIYKHPMEPAIGNERLALAELIRRKIPDVHPGPDVWTPTKELYPEAFAGDLLHPNSVGKAVMAHHWLATLCKYDGVDVPDWSREEMEQAIEQGVPPAEREADRARRAARRAGRRPPTEGADGQPEAP
ncbi:MAG: SGNH/GDSL hydrolase family protein, partial [Armatimonadota bacterium]